MVFSESEYSSRMKWPAMPMFNRSRYVRTLVSVTKAIICQRTEVGRSQAGGVGSATTGGGVLALREAPLEEAQQVRRDPKTRSVEVRHGRNCLGPLRWRA